MLLIMFFTFFRLSNMVPSIPLAFYITRHLYRADFMVHEEGASIVVKRTKTLQAFKSRYSGQDPQFGV